MIFENNNNLVWEKKKELDFTRILRPIQHWRF